MLSIYHARRLPAMLENPFCGDYLDCGAGVKLDVLNQDDLYQEAAEAFGPSLERLGRAYEADPEARRDLLQDIHLQLWRSFAHFDGRCSLRTWVYRVAHNVAIRHVVRQRRMRKTLASIEEIESMASNERSELVASQNQALDRLGLLIQKLKPLDRQIIICIWRAWMPLRLPKSRAFRRQMSP
jgi:RNA polymerase sigma-70 factor, ECF subfamily